MLDNQLPEPSPQPETIRDLALQSWQTEAARQITDLPTAPRKSGISESGRSHILIALSHSPNLEAEIAEYFANEYLCSSANHYANSRSLEHLSRCNPGGTALQAIAGEIDRHSAKIEKLLVDNELRPLRLSPSIGAIANMVKTCSGLGAVMSDELVERLARINQAAVADFSFSSEAIADDLKLMRSVVHSAVALHHETRGAHPIDSIMLKLEKSPDASKLYCEAALALGRWIPTEIVQRFVDETAEAGGSHHDRHYFYARHLFQERFELLAAVHAAQGEPEDKARTVEKMRSVSRHPDFSADIESHLVPDVPPKTGKPWASLMIGGQTFHIGGTSSSTFESEGPDRASALAKLAGLDRIAPFNFQEYCGDEGLLALGGTPEERAVVTPIVKRIFEENYTSGSFLTWALRRLDGISSSRPAEADAATRAIASVILEVTKAGGGDDVAFELSNRAFEKGERLALQAAQIELQRSYLDGGKTESPESNFHTLGIVFYMLACELEGPEAYGDAAQLIEALDSEKERYFEGRYKQKDEDLKKSEDFWKVKDPEVRGYLGLP